MKKVRGSLSTPAMRGRCGPNESGMILTSHWAMASTIGNHGENHGAHPKAQIDRQKSRGHDDARGRAVSVEGYQQVSGAVPTTSFMGSWPAKRRMMRISGPNRPTSIISPKKMIANNSNPAMG